MIKEKLAFMVINIMCIVKYFTKRQGDVETEVWEQNKIFPPLALKYYSPDVERF